MRRAALCADIERKTQQVLHSAFGYVRDDIDAVGGYVQDDEECLCRASPAASGFRDESEFHVREGRLRDLQYADGPKQANG
jgi:hypothetical protein